MSHGRRSLGHRPARTARAMRSRALTTARATFTYGRRLDARHTPETPASLACLAAHAAAAAAAPHSVLWTRASAGFQNARRAPASSEQTNRATALYHSYQQRILTHRIHSPRCDPW